MAQWKTGQLILDEYTIEKELGRGGMGRVWLVKSNSTGRRFAVKQTLLKDEKHRKAFLAELQTWIDLPEHPNVVSCRFFRTVGDEIVIFADFIECGSLADWIAKKKLTNLEQILDVAIQFAWGLHAIHERGLIHQDVKPGNVLMTTDGVPMVTDFGLARARMRAADGDFVSPALPPGQQSVLVSTGGMTPAYASPEQRFGKLLSRKTDIWSWGVSVLDILMGGVSCRHGGHIAAEVLEDFIVNGRMEDALPDIPVTVFDALRRCFARSPSERWDNLEDTTQSLIQILVQATGDAYARDPVRNLRNKGHAVQHDRWVKNIQWRDPRQWLREAYRAVGRDPAEAEDYQPPPALTRKGTIVGDLAIYEEVERLLTMAIGSDDEENANLLASFYADKALICFSLDDTNGAIGAHDRCIAIREQLVNRKGRHEFACELASAYMHKAIFVKHRGDHRGALDLYDRCIAIQERLLKREGRTEIAADLARAYMNKACDVTFLGDPRAAIALFDQSITTFLLIAPRDERKKAEDDLAHAYMNKAGSLILLGDFRGAVTAYDLCIHEHGHRK